MAKFESFGMDDDFFPDEIELDCPVCGKPLSIPLDRETDAIICPHCNSEIEISSS